MSQVAMQDEVGMNNEERFYDDATIYFGSGALLSTAHSRGTTNILLIHPTYTKSNQNGTCRPACMRGSTVILHSLNHLAFSILWPVSYHEAHSGVR